MFYSLLKNISKKRKKQLVLLFIVTLISSIFESVSIGIILPFIGFLTGAETIYSKYIVTGLSKIGFHSNNINLQYVVSSGLILSATIAACSRILLLKLNTEVSFGIASDWSCSLYKRMITSSYIEIIKENSANMIGNIGTRSNMVAFYYVVPLINIFSSVMIGIFITAALIMIDLRATLIAIIFFGLSYYLLSIKGRKKLRQDSKTILSGTNYKIKYIQETFLNMRDIIIEKSSSVYLQYFYKNEFALKDAQARSQFLSFYPKYILEALSIIFLVLIAIYMQYSGALSSESTIPVIAALALGGQKMIPLLQQIYSAIAAIHTGRESVEAVMCEFNKVENKLPNNNLVKPLHFNQKIVFNNIGFKYESSAPILEDVNFTIEVGDIVGIIGKSGGGKSTLLDLIIGLLNPTVGTIYIDGQLKTPLINKSWMENISHVPQSVFIFNSTIEDNIGYGIEGNSNLFLKAIKSASLEDLIEEVGSDYMLSELGKNISGGQRQRIGVARAVYRNRPIMILDEATSALDEDTEESIMDSLKANGYTIIMVTHKNKLLRYCNKIFRVSGGTVVEEACV